MDEYYENFSKEKAEVESELKNKITIIKYTFKRIHNKLGLYRGTTSNADDGD